MKYSPHIALSRFHYQDFVDTFFLELEGELRVEETVTKIRALTLKSTLLSGDVAVTIGGKVNI